ncbi:MAG TPA: hypothetical protein VFU07_05135 [Candidatus Lumbricidophila sp.]|nr:hypothetical protein [Candidatus Lumbricidophila sp.]
MSSFDTWALLLLIFSAVGLIYWILAQRHLVADDAETEVLAGSVSDPAKPMLKLVEPPETRTSPRLYDHAVDGL